MTVRHIAFAAGLLALAVPASTVDAQIPRGIAVRGELWFHANATMGAFRGATRAVRGAIAGGDSLRAVRGWIEFDAAELATGNGLRDRDMRSSLKADRFPVIRFDLDTVRVTGADQDSDSVHVELRGRMQIHGVTRAVQAASLVRRSGTLIRVTGDFDLHVPDYGIGGLRKMFGMFSMDPDVKIGFDVTFNTAADGIQR